MQNYLFTSESVSHGHPDKICDQISDAILDLFLSKDPEARTAIECFATTNTLIIGGETKSTANISNAEIEQTARNVIKEIGYEQDGFHWKNVKITILIHAQSTDIAQGVDESTNHEEGAGDQGIMFGYACNETKSLMPAAIYYAHQILRDIFKAIESGKIIKLGPDAKTQITIEYQDKKPKRAHTILLSIQHPENLSTEEIINAVKPIITATLPNDWIDSETKFLVNPTGRFVIGGPEGDAGLTGRKIIIDTYGGVAQHGGGAFSGKDPTKVDRSAAYIARYMAKNVVAAGLADKCLIQLSYAIGVAEPLSFYLTTENSNQVPEQDIVNKLQELIDLTPKGIRTFLNLNRPIFQQTAAYGHFGRKPTEKGLFSWEKTDLAQTLKDSLRKKVS
jgi:S-adenosylmethionine synthetase